MRCLVTGAAGFIASHLTERLLAEGYEVVGVDSFVDFYPRALKECNLDGARSWRNFTFLAGDLLELDLVSLLDGVDWIFHLAAQAGVSTSWGNDFARYLNCNVLATRHLLDAAKEQARLRRFVFASSSSIYGQPTSLPMEEHTLPRPDSPYGMTKLAAEHLCALYHRNFNLPVVSLRYFTVYGPRQRPDMALQRFCQAIVKGEQPRIFGDGAQSRDFTFVSDIVAATLLAAASEAAIGETLNIAGGSRTTLNEVLTLLQEISGRTITCVRKQAQHGDVRDTQADISRAARLLGYAPEVSLREGLARQFAWLADLSAQTTSVPML